MPPLTRAPSAFAVPLVAAVAAAVALATRVPGALDLPFWQDEVASARVIVEPSAGRVLEHVRETESTPPGWYLLAWAVHRAGVPVENVRLLSVVLGAVLAALVVVYARRLLPLWAAFAAGLLAAVGWQFVAHGRELRAYALLMLLALAFGLLLERAVRAPTRGRLLLLALVTAAGLLTHYFFLFTLLAGLLWLWTEPSARAVRARITGAAGLALFPLAAWAPGFVSQAGEKRFDWIGSVDPLKIAYFYSTIFDYAGPLYAGVPAPFSRDELLRFVVLAGVLAGSLVLARRSSSGRLCAALAVVPVAFAGLVWTVLDVFNTRNLLATAPFAVVALVAALAALPRLVAIPAAAAAVGFAAVGLSQGPAFGPPADRVAGALAAQGWRAGDGILLFGGFHDFRGPTGWYLPGRPTLRLVPARALCSDVYVVASEEEGWELLGQLRGLRAVRELRLVTWIRIARVRRTPGLLRVAFAAGASLLGTGQRCASAASARRAVP